NMDIVGPRADLSGYKLVFAPQLALMDSPLAARLRQFVARGGTLIMSAESAIKNRDNAFTMDAIPIGLTNLFGAELDSFQTYQPPSATNNAVQFAGNDAVPVDVFAEVLHPTTARVVGRWDRDYLKNAPAATEHDFGRGKAVYYGSLFNLEAARYLIKRYANQAGLKPLLDGVPSQVEVTCRSNGRAAFYFLLNHGDSPVTVRVGDGFADVLSGEPAAPSMTLGPFDYRVLERDRQ
ncbi:MAG: beta-galactosidase trimerization domain-containing protein, partial [Limisphaerales bacterium]